MKRGAVLIEAEDLVSPPPIDIEIVRPGHVLVRWNLGSLAVATMEVQDGERIHIAATKLGQQRVRRAIEALDAKAVYVGASGGMAKARGPATEAVAVGEAVVRALLKPGSLCAEIHAKDCEDDARFGGWCSY